MEINDEIKKNRKGIVFGAVSLIIITIVVLMVLFNLNDFNETMKVISAIKGKDILLAFGCLIIYIIICPFSMSVLCNVKSMNTSKIQNYLIGASEHFFNGITPYQTGAQPFQVYSFYKRGVKTSEATGVVITNYLSQLIGLNILCIFSLIYAGDFFKSFMNEHILWIPIIGLFMNVFTLVVFIAIIYCKWVRVMFTNVLKFFCKFKLIGKRMNDKIPTFEEYCNNAQLGAKEIMHHPVAFVISTIIRTVALLFYYAIPFFILRSLDVKIAYTSLVYVILATCFAVNAVVWIPTPGTSGGIEFSFTVLFAIFAGFSGSVAAAASIVWRGLTYYLLLIVSFVEYLILEMFFKGKKEK